MAESNKGERVRLVIDSDKQDEDGRDLDWGDGWENWKSAPMPSLNAGCGKDDCRSRRSGQICKGSAEGKPVHPVVLEFQGQVIPSMGSSEYEGFVRWVAKLDDQYLRKYGLIYDYNLTSTKHSENEIRWREAHRRGKFPSTCPSNPPVSLEQFPVKLSCEQVMGVLAKIQIATERLSISQQLEIYILCIRYARRGLFECEGVVIEATPLIQVDLKVYGQPLYQTPYPLSRQAEEKLEEFTV